MKKFQNVQTHMLNLQFYVKICPKIYWMKENITEVLSHCVKTVIELDVRDGENPVFPS